MVHDTPPAKAAARAHLAGIWGLVAEDELIIVLAVRPVLRAPVGTL
jgi:hypothetical protein